MVTEYELAGVLNELADLAPHECSSFDAQRASRRRVGLRRTALRRTAPDRRTKLAIASLVGVGLVGGGGVFAYSEITTPKVTDDTVVTCYITPSYGPEADYTTLQEQEVAGGAPTHLTDAVAACGRMWREGILPGPHKSGFRVDPNADHPVPGLTPCILPDGTVAVFPAPATCTSVGLPSQPPSPSPRRPGRS